MSQTKKNQVIPVVETPFSPRELEQLKTILRSPTSKRTALKEVFMRNFKRQRKDVDNWLYRNDPSKAQGKKRLGRAKKNIDSQITIPLLGPIPSGKKVTTKWSDREGKNKKTKKAELRVPFTALRVEGNILIIDIDIQK